MNTPYLYLNRLAIISICLLGLNACTPSFKTTAEECVTFAPVSLALAQDEDNTELKVSADSLTNDYKLYLEDALNSFNGAQSKSGDTLSPLSADEQAAIAFIFNKANEKMGYTIEDGLVAYANNPLDYIESLVAATDEDEIIGTFVDAKQNVAQAIERDDSVCNYRNTAITLIIEDPDAIDPTENKVKTINTQLDISFNPFNDGLDKDVDQIILISENDEPQIERDDETDTPASLKKSYAGINRIAGAEFQAVGVSPSEVRQFTISDNLTNETYFFDDDFDQLKLGQIVSSWFNAACTDMEGEQTACPDGVATRIPQHEQCNGGREVGNIVPVESTEENTTPDEVGQIQVNSFTVVEGNDALTDIQRFRAEVDYDLNEIRLYASKYAEAILRAGAPEEDYDPETHVIFNPTRCEKQAVLDDLLADVPEEEQQADVFEGVRLTVIQDTNYDVIFLFDDDGEPLLDDEGNQQKIEPTPVFTFQGTAIPERQ